MTNRSIDRVIDKSVDCRTGKSVIQTVVPAVPAIRQTVYCGHRAVEI